MYPHIVGELVNLHRMEPQSNAAPAPTQRPNFSIALQWITSNCNSNTELATLSNVCRAWRTVVAEQLLVNFRGKSPVSSLLLPCMVQKLLSQKEKEMNSTLSKHDDTTREGRNPQISKASAMTIENVNDQSKEPYRNDCIESNSSFCLAWFEPKGIQLDSVNIADDSLSSSESEKEEEFVPSNHHIKNNRKMISPSSPLRVPREGYFRRTGMNMGGRQNTVYRKTVVKAWIGYKNPMDVLLPFGYTNYFVNKLLTTAVESFIKSGSIPPYRSSNLNASKNENVTHEISSKSKNKSTFAVRGAIEAKPERLPWDEARVLDGSMIHDLKRQYNKINQIKELQIVESSNEIEKERLNGSYNEIFRELEEKRTKLQYQLDFDMSRQKKNIKKIKKKVKEIKYSLPRLVLSSNAKNQRYSYQHVISKQSECPTTSIHKEKRQRSVQFLNADCSRAVRMQTRPFDCGTVSTPITIFCVAIATEDGTFVSGLRKRLELGHLYPRNEIDEMIDMSPICIGIGVDTGEASSNSSIDKGDRYSGKLESMGSLREIFNEISNEKDNSEHKNDENDSNSSCWDDESNHDGDESSEEFRETQPPIILRGKTGPGRWHCYTAVFDVNEGVLRVDGLTENEAIKDKELRECKNDFSNLKGVLDGLTIGSDHSFEMPLCCGGIDIGEGEGAISEIAVFKGILSEPDLQRIEKYLMKKHGISAAIAPIEKSIPKGNTMSRPFSSWQEDEWNREAHALMQQFPPYYDLGNKKVPLGALTNHRSVAWHRKNDVTGAHIRVSRIGSKFSTGSSSSL